MIPALWAARRFVHPRAARKWLRQERDRLVLATATTLSVMLASGAAQDERLLCHGIARAGDRFLKGLADALKPKC